MSDFFGDDFTAELKTYFLQSLMSEIEKFEILVDDKLWMRTAQELSKQCESWSTDAKTNEFNYFSEWLAGFSTQSEHISSKTELQGALKALKAYTQKLLTTRGDSSELMRSFDVNLTSQQEVQFLHCRIEGNEFAIPILNVVEIGGLLPIYTLPEERHGLSGFIPYRGAAIPVLKLEDYGFTKASGSPIHVICAYEGVKFSMPVSSTDDLIQVKSESLQEISSLELETNTPEVPLTDYAKTFFIHEAKTFMVLDFQYLVAA